MDYKDIINYNIDKLINIYLNKGVQINELIDNIFNDIYKEIRVYKNSEYTIVELNFIEDKEIVMNYIYEGKLLVRVEEYINENKTVLWDRDIVIGDLLDSIIIYMKKIYTNEEIQKVIDTLPEDLKLKHNSSLELSDLVI